MNHPQPILRTNTYVQMPSATPSLYAFLSDGITYMESLDWPPDKIETFANWSTNSYEACKMYRQSIGEVFSKPLN